MTLAQIIAHFGNQVKTAKALNISRSTIANWIWRDNGKIPHWWHAQIIQEAAKHGLIIDKIE